MNFRFQNRNDAGRFLAEGMLRFANQPDVLVLALPRGGIPVGYEMARALNAPLDVIIDNPELEQTYRNGRSPLLIARHTVVLVDDGAVAGGGEMRAAILRARKENPRRIIAAIPVAETAALEELRAVADEVICGQRLPNLGSVGFWYEDFSQIRDTEIQELLERLALVAY